MIVFNHILMCLLGTAFMFGGFYSTGIGGAFSRGPYHPISKAGRIILFLAGAAVFIDGFNRLLIGFAAPHVWWLGATPFVAVIVFAVVLNSRAIRARMASAVTSGPTVAIKFAGRLPSALVALRIAFVVIVGTMIVFGISPISFSTMRVGVLSCVVALFAVGLLYAGLETHYLNTGRATKVSLKDNETLG